MSATATETTADLSPPRAIVATNGLGMRQDHMPHLEQADDRLTAAKDAFASATAAHNEKASAWNAARIQLGNVLNTRSAAAATLAQAQSELTPAPCSQARITMRCGNGPRMRRPRSTR